MNINLLELLPRDVLERIADMLWFNEDALWFDHLGRIKRGKRWIGRSKRGRPCWQEANYLYQLAQSDVMLTHKSK